jgi:hypothetical protein
MNEINMDDLCDKCGHRYGVHSHGVQGPCTVCKTCSSFINSGILWNSEKFIVSEQPVAERLHSEELMIEKSHEAFLKSRQISTCPKFLEVDEIFKIN